MDRPEGAPANVEPSLQQFFGCREVALLLHEFCESVQAVRDVRMIGTELALADFEPMLELDPGTFQIAKLQEHLSQAGHVRHEVSALSVEAVHLNAQGLLV